MTLSIYPFYNLYIHLLLKISILILLALQVVALQA